MAHFGILFDGFEELAEILDRNSKDLKKATNEALEETHKLITPKIHNVMEKHHDTGDTEKSIIDEPLINWQGSKATVHIGFDLKNGGFPSIFLMYGTKPHEIWNQYGGNLGGHPGMPKDTELFNAIKGTRTKKEIAEKQREVMNKYINLARKK